jgi:hypothetical protein
VYLLPLALVFQEHQAGPEHVPLSIIIPEQSLLPCTFMVEQVSNKMCNLQPRFEDVLKYKIHSTSLSPETLLTCHALLTNFPMPWHVQNAGQPKRERRKRREAATRSPGMASILAIAAASSCGMCKVQFTFFAARNTQNVILILFVHD